MITFEKVPIEPHQSQKLREWMTQEGMGVLLKICEAKVKEEECLALAKAQEAAAGAPLKLDIANAHLVEAHEWATVVAKLREVMRSAAFYYARLS